MYMLYNFIGAIKSGLENSSFNTEYYVHYFFMQQTIKNSFVLVFAYFFVEKLDMVWYNIIVVIKVVIW